MTEQGKKKIKIKTTGNQLELTVDRGWYEPRRTIENERISSIQCPSCKSTDKKHIIKRNNNGIMGQDFVLGLLKNISNVMNVEQCIKTYLKLKNIHINSNLMATNVIYVEKPSQKY